MDSVKANFEARSNAAGELQGLYTEAAGRELSAEEAQTESRLHTTIQDLDGRIQRELEQREADQAAAEARSQMTAADEAREAAAKADKSGTPSDSDTLRSMTHGQVVEFRDDDPLNAHIDGTGVAGGATVPDTLAGTLLESLRQRSYVMNQARKVRTSGVGDISFPKVASYSAASIVAEEGEISGDEPTFGQVSLGAYKLAFMVRTSNELLEDSGVNIASFIARQGTDALVDGANAYLVSGTGTGQPQGIDAATGVDSAASGVIDEDDLVEWFYSLGQPYRPRSSWVFSDDAIKAIRKLKDGNDNYLWQRALTAGEPDTIMGRPVVTDVNLADVAAGATVGVFGDLDGYLVREAASVRVQRSDEFLFNYDQVAWRFTYRFDGKIIDDSALIALDVAA